MHSQTARELQDLIAVHKFYTPLIEKELGYPVPVPEVVEEALTDQDDPEPFVGLLKRWLGFMDMAVTPPMVRDGLKEPNGSAEALLRYFSLKTSRVDNDRDKADFVASCIFRAFVTSRTGTHHLEVERQFERDLHRIMEGAQIAPLPDDRMRLVKEFGFLRSEVEDFRHFDALMDSGIMQRVRALKQALQESFYHPHTLAQVASYNHFFGARFDELFREAASQIKTFATKVQKEGASVASRIEGDVTVKQLQDVEEEQTLSQEYGRARENFQKISQLKKVVDKKTPTRGAAVAASAPMAAPASSPITRGGATAAHAAPAVSSMEPSRLTAMIDTICNAIRNTDPKATPAVPMPFGNVVLSSAEADAFRAEYRTEKSFRGEFATALALLVALNARMGGELKEYRAKKSASQFLWKPHAESLGWLLTAANTELAGAERICQIAQQRGLTDKVAAITATMDKLRSQMRLVSVALQE